MKKAPIFILLAGVLLLAACSPAAPTAAPLPTQDLNVVRTQSAQTVVAKITADAAANPTATPLPAATATPVPPTAAPVQPTATLAIPTLTTAPTRVSGGTGGGSYVPTLPAGSDVGQVTSVSPYNKVFKAGEDFDAKWTIKNIGNKDWDNTYYIKYISGADMSGTKLVYLPGTVKVHESTSVVVDMNAPQSAGTYNSLWGLVNDNGTVFCYLYLTVVVQ